MSQLPTDNIRIEAQTDGVVIEPAYIGYLRSQGYPINEILETHVVDSNSRDISHVVMQLITTDKPAGHPECDIVADKTTITVCSCEDFRYNKSVDVSKQTLASGRLGSCKHISRCFKHVAAEADEQQETLG